MTETTAAAAHGSHASHDDHGMSHVMSVPMLLGVFFALLVLTVITVTASNMQLGEWDILVAMGIATVKASLVAAYFMHLRYDKPFNCLIFIFTLCFFALFVGMALVDSEQYDPDVRAWEVQQEKP